jgi:hypothetical protein
MKKYMIYNEFFPTGKIIIGSSFRIDEKNNIYIHDTIGYCICFFYAGTSIELIDEVIE